MIRLMLNLFRKENYAFFDAESKVHMNIANPINSVKEITPAIKRAILAGTVIDIDKVTGINVRDNDEKVHDVLLAKFNITRDTNGSMPMVARANKEEVSVENKAPNAGEVDNEETPADVKKDKKGAKKNSKKKEGEE